jgi:hypothetical protein
MGRRALVVRCELGNAMSRQQLLNATVLLCIIVLTASLAAMSIWLEPR